MFAFVVGCIVAALLAAAGYYVLSLVQEPVSEAFSTSAVRLNGSDQMPLSGEMLAAIVGAVIGAVLTMIATSAIELLKAHRERQRREQKDLADYLTQIADHLEGMAREFKNKQIPHIHGRAFVGLVSLFRDILVAKLPDQVNQRLKVLDYLVQHAGALDEELYQLKSVSDLKPEIQNHLDHWILDAERLSGDLKAEARKMLMSGPARGHGGGSQGGLAPQS